MTIPAKRVVVLCFEGMELLDVAGPCNVWSAATRLAPHRPGYAIRLAAPRAGPVATAGGVSLVATHTTRGLRGPIDTLVVPGGLSLAARSTDSTPLVSAIQKLAPRTRRVVGVCTGALLLADAGQLNGRRAVTHWSACDALRRRGPQCTVERDPIFINDGKVWTSAGVTAGMDLALALVQADHGRALALDVARWLVMYVHRPGGQSQFSAPLAAQSADRDPIVSLVAWIPGHLRADLTVAALARRAAMSPRNFARVFVAQTGHTPAAWVTSVRLEAARRQLEDTAQTVAEVAGATGFASAEVLHRTFRRRLGATPLQYRRRFAPRAERT